MAGGQKQQRNTDFGAELMARADAVRQRVPLSSIIGADIALRKAGREWTGLCPFHGDRRDGAFMVNDAKGIYHCFACSANGDVITYLEKRKGLDFMAALRMLEADSGIDFRDARQRAEFDRAREKRDREALADAARRRANAKNFWLHAAPGEGSPAEDYLAGRGIDLAVLGRFPGAIRFRHDAHCTEVGRKLPCMATAIALPGEGLVACHRTYLAYERGRWVKAKLDKPKMVLGDFYGGAMPLWKGDSRATLDAMPAGQGVALSEGIEDALSVAVSAPELRYLAAVSLDNMRNIKLPVQAGDLTILCQRDGDSRMLRAAAARAEGDEAAAMHHEASARGIEAATERAIAALQTHARDQGSGRQVLLAWPAAGFKDFNDQLRGQRMEGA